jgi:hypothetical protein
MTGGFFFSVLLLFLYVVTSFCSGGWIRTTDREIMKLTSYQLLAPRDMFCLKLEIKKGGVLLHRPFLSLCRTGTFHYWNKNCLMNIFFVKPAFVKIK